MLHRNSKTACISIQSLIHSRRRQRHSGHEVRGCERREKQRSGCDQGLSQLEEVMAICVLEGTEIGGQKAQKRISDLATILMERTFFASQFKEKCRKNILTEICLILAHEMLQIKMMEKYWRFFIVDSLDILTIIYFYIFVLSIASKAFFNYSNFP